MDQELTTAVARAIPLVLRHVPPTPAADLGRPGERRPERRRRREEPGVAAALRGLRTADRLFGALELAVEALDVPVPRELVAHLAPRDGEFGVIGFIGEDEAVLAVRLLEVAHPGATDFVLEAVRGLVREDVIAPLLVVEPEYADEAGIAGRHGALHLALCVATSAALLRALGTEVARAVPAVVGTALGAAVLLLADLPAPEAYGRAVLEKRRAEYAYPRWSSNNPVVRDHRFALAEGPVPDDVDFSANGLVAVVPGGLVVRTGLAEGRVPVSLRVSAEPPVVVATEREHRWIGSSSLEAAATVTVVVGLSADDVLRAFGSDPDASEPVEELRNQGVDDWVAVREVDGVVVAFEENGYLGTLPEVLERLSRNGKAASAFWNANARTALSFARAGEVVAAFEPGPCDTDDPEVLAAFDGLDFDDPRHGAAKLVTAVAGFTGHVVAEADLDAIRVAHVATRG